MKTRRLLALPLITVVLMCAPLACLPTPELVPYAEAPLRLEARPPMADLLNAPVRQATEAALAQAGVSARWVRVTDNAGNPLLTNPYLPCRDPNAAANEAALKAWVDEIHQQGMAAISWLPSSRCDGAATAHPDWQSVLFSAAPASGRGLCPITGWGPAFTNYCVYVLDKLGLDGLYLDGGFWGPPVLRPRVLACRCAACQARFKADTGQDLPEQIDWNNPVFRRWVAWRYQVFSGFYAQLAQTVHASHPKAVIVVNDYHRPGGDWRIGMPLNPYSADIVSGSEAHGSVLADFTAHLIRAYDRPQNEIWAPFGIDQVSPEVNAQLIVQQATNCYVAGASPSYGTRGGWAEPKYPAMATLVSPVLRALQPWVRATSLPCVAVHLSQQTETFHFGRAGADSNFDPYWKSLMVWNQGLEAAHVPADFLFDADLTPARLATYKALVLPLSLALSPEQAQTVVAYAQGGGTVILGVAAGQLDAEGQPVAHNPLGQALGFSFASTPSPEGTEVSRLRLTPAAGGDPLNVVGMYSALTLADPAWSPLYSDPGGHPVVAQRAFGRGHVLLSAIDPAAATTPEVTFDGQSSVVAGTDSAASGHYSLKFTASEITSRRFYPELLMELPTFDATTARGGQLDCDVMVQAGAAVNIDISSEIKPPRGPAVLLGEKTETTPGVPRPIPLPVGRWVHLSLTYDLAQGDRTCVFNLALTGGGANVHRQNVPAGSPAYNRTDFVRFTSEGSEGSVYYLDNLRFARVNADGKADTLVNEDFEDGGAAVVGQTQLVQALARRLLEFAPPPVQLRGPETIHLGVFQDTGGQVLVHLQNTRGLLRDWQGKTGPAVTLHCAFPVRSAQLAVSGQALTVHAAANGADIDVPSVGLYQVVQITRQ